MSVVEAVEEIRAVRQECKEEWLKAVGENE